jgi:hypothetical protein
MAPARQAVPGLRAAMICDSYVIYVCPHPDCVVWDMHPEICDDHHAHPDGDYPRLKPLTVRPRPEVLEAYYKPRILTVAPSEGTQ